MTEIAHPMQTYNIAGLGSRTWAFVIDWHIRVIIAALLFLLLSLADGTGFSLVNRGAFSQAAIIGAALVYLLYHPVLEVITDGQTFGKRWVGLRVVTEENETASAVQLIMRNVLRMIDCLPGNYALGLLIGFFNDKERRLGDILTGTQVVFVEEKTKN